MIVTGVPKSGTHWLAADLRHKGHEVSHLHLPYERWRGEEAVCIFRDPRDCLISMCRHRGDGLGEAAIIARMSDFYHGSLPDVYLAYLSYWGAVPCVMFPQMTANVETVTKTGRHSDWREHWTDTIAGAWEAAGGLDLEKRLTSVNLMAHIRRHDGT